MEHKLYKNRKYPQKNRTKEPRSLLKRDWDQALRKVCISCFMHSTCLEFSKFDHQYNLNQGLNAYTHVLTVHSKCINDHTLRSDIFLPKCPTNVRQIWESTLSKSDYLVGHRGLGRTWEWIFKDIFYISRGEYVKHFVSVLSFRYVECAGT
jgi:hypothetical protein